MNLTGHGILTDAVAPVAGGAIYHFQTRPRLVQAARFGNSIHAPSIGGRLSLVGH